MKIRENYILRTVAGVHVVIACGDGVDLSTMLSLNDTGKFLWEQLQTAKTEEQLLEAVLAAYATDPTEAAEYIHAFVQELGQYGCLEEQ